MYPLVRELAAEGIPVVVACRILKLARQPYYRWLTHPIGDRELDQAHLASTLFDAHRDDPEFGYRLLADEAREAGLWGCDRTVWRIRTGGGACSASRAAVTSSGPAHQPTTTWSAVTSPLRARTSCGSPTSPNTGPVRGRCTCARSRTNGQTGSSATRSVTE